MKKVLLGLMLATQIASAETVKITDDMSNTWILPVNVYGKAESKSILVKGDKTTYQDINLSLFKIPISENNFDYLSFSLNNEYQYADGKKECKLSVVIKNNELPKEIVAGNCRVTLEVLGTSNKDGE